MDRNQFNSMDQVMVDAFFERNKDLSDVFIPRIHKFEQYEKIPGEKLAKFRIMVLNSITQLNIMLAAVDSPDKLIQMYVDKIFPEEMDLEVIDDIFAPFSNTGLFDNIRQQDPDIAEYNELLELLKKMLFQIFNRFGEDRIYEFLDRASLISGILNVHGTNEIKRLINSQPVTPGTVTTNSGDGLPPQQEDTARTKSVTLGDQLRNALDNELTPETLDSLFLSYQGDLVKIFTQLETQPNFQWDSSENQDMIGNSNQLVEVLYKAINSPIDITVIKTSLAKAGLSLNDSLLNLIKATSEKFQKEEGSRESLKNFVGIMMYNMMDVKDYSNAA